MIDYLPPAKTREEERAMREALSSSGIGTLKGLVRGTGIPDLASALTWGAGEAHGPLALSSLLNSSRIGEEDREGLDTIYDKYFGVLGDEVSEEKAQEKVNPMRGNYLETVQKIVDNIVPFESNENARITEKIMELMVAGADLTYLVGMIAKSAPKGFKYVMNKLKKTGTENVDEVDAAVTRATGEDFDLKTAIDEVSGLEDTIEQAYALETRLYDIKKAMKQEGGQMSRTNLQKYAKEINEIQNKIKKLSPVAGADKPVPLLTDQRVDQVVTKATGEKGAVYKRTEDVRKIDPYIAQKRILTMQRKKAKELEKLKDKQEAELLKKHGVAEDNTRDDRWKTGGYFYTTPPGMTQEALSAVVLKNLKKYSQMKEAARKKWDKKMEPLYDDLDEANRYYKGEMKKKEKFSAETEKSLGLDPDSINNQTGSYEQTGPFLKNRAEDIGALAGKLNKDKRMIEIEKRFQAEAKEILNDFETGFDSRSSYGKDYQLNNQRTDYTLDKYLVTQDNEALLRKRLVELKKRKAKEMEKLIIELNEETDRFAHTRRITELARGGSVQNSVDYALDQWK